MRIPKADAGRVKDRTLFPLESAGTQKTRINQTPKGCSTQEHLNALRVSHPPSYPVVGVALIYDDGSKLIICSSVRRKTALEKEFGGDVEAAAEAFDVVFVELALAAENFGDDTGSAEDVGEVFLEEAVLVH